MHVKSRSHSLALTLLVPLVAACTSNVDGSGGPLLVDRVLDYGAALPTELQSNPERLFAQVVANDPMAPKPVNLVSYEYGPGDRLEKRTRLELPRASDSPLPPAGAKQIEDVLMYNPSQPDRLDSWNERIWNTHAPGGPAMVLQVQDQYTWTNGSIAEELVTITNYANGAPQPPSMIPALFMTDTNGLVISKQTDSDKDPANGFENVEQYMRDPAGKLLSIGSGPKGWSFQYDNGRLTAASQPYNDMREEHQYTYVRSGEAYGIFDRGEYPKGLEFKLTVFRRGTRGSAAEEFEKFNRPTDFYCRDASDW